MGDLQNKRVQDSYGGLLHTTEDTGLDGANKSTIQDGNGVDTALKVSTGEVDVTKLQTGGTDRISETGELVNVSGNVSQLTNDAGYLTDVPADVMREGEDVSLLNNDAGYLTDVPADVMREGEDISLLNNDAAYIDAAGAPVQSVNGQTGAVVIPEGGLDNLDDASNDGSIKTQYPTDTAKNVVEPTNLDTTNSFGNLYLSSLLNLSAIDNTDLDFAGNVFTGANSSFGTPWVWDRTGTSTFLRFKNNTFIGEHDSITLSDAGSFLNTGNMLVVGGYETVFQGSNNQSIIAGSDNTVKNLNTSMILGASNDLVNGVYDTLVLGDGTNSSSAIQRSIIGGNSLSLGGVSKSFVQAASSTIGNVGTSLYLQDGPKNQGDIRNSVLVGLYNGTTSTNENERVNNSILIGESNQGENNQGGDSWNGSIAVGTSNTNTWNTSGASPLGVAVFGNNNTTADTTNVLVQGDGNTTAQQTDSNPSQNIFIQGATNTGVKGSSVFVTGQNNDLSGTTTPYGLAVIGRDNTISGNPSGVNVIGNSITVSGATTNATVISGLPSQVGGALDETDGEGLFTTDITADTIDVGVIKGLPYTSADYITTDSNGQVSGGSLNAGSGVTIDKSSPLNMTINAQTDEYVLGAFQDGANVDLRNFHSGTGSGVTTTVQLTAGTNITLTETGNNEITIDAAGGGGGGGLELYPVQSGFNYGNPWNYSPNMTTASGYGQRIIMRPVFLRAGTYASFHAWYQTGSSEAGSFNRYAIYNADTTTLRAVSDGICPQPTTKIANAEISVPATNTGGQNVTLATPFTIPTDGIYIECYIYDNGVDANMSGGFSSLDIQDQGNNNNIFGFQLPYKSPFAGSRSLGQTHLISNGVVYTSFPADLSSQTSWNNTSIAPGFNWRIQ